MSRLPALFLALVLSACATTSKKSNLEALKPTVESFHQLIRWRDYRSAARLIVPERRVDFQRARIDKKVNAIFEAYSFQDHTSQRIRRAIDHLHQVETMLTSIAPTSAAPPDLAQEEIDRLLAG